MCLPLCRETAELQWIRVSVILPSVYLSLFFTYVCRSVAGYRMTDYTRKKEAEEGLERINIYIKRLSKGMPETLGRKIWKLYAKPHYQYGANKYQTEDWRSSGTHVHCKKGTLIFNIVKGKGKAVPLQAWSGPKGSRKLRFPDFMTTAQEGDKVINLRHRPHLPPGNSPGTHFC